MADEAKHTPGPWDITLRDDGATLGKYKRIANFPDSNPNWEADAQRVYACLRACRGIPTEQLEGESINAALAPFRKD